MALLTKLGLLLLVAMVNVAAQGCLRYVFTKVQASTGAALGLSSISVVAGYPLAWVGVGLQGVGFILWLVVISRLELTYAFPMAGAFFTLLLFIQGYFILSENVTFTRILGALLIMGGSLLIQAKATTG